MERLSGMVINYLVIAAAGLLPLALSLHALRARDLPAKPVRVAGIVFVSVLMGGVVGAAILGDLNFGPTLLVIAGGVAALERLLATPKRVPS